MNEWDPSQFRQASAGELKELSALSHHRSIGALLFEWALILIAITVHTAYPNPLVYLLAVIVIGSRLYALYSLLHDCLHFLTLRNRTWNDRIGQVFMGLPLFIHLPAMRKIHFDHHKYLLTDQDPEMALLRYTEFQYPKTRGKLLLLYAMDLSGINFLRYRLQKLWRWLKSGSIRGIISGPKKWMHLFYIALFGISIVFGWLGFLIAYWIVPYATVYQLLNRIRLSTEHFNLEEDRGFHTRSMQLDSLEGGFMSPHNLGFHTEHHLFPAVPFYHLPELHRMLAEEPAFRERENLGTSYTDVLKICIRKQ